MLALMSLVPLFPLLLGIFRLVQMRPLTCCQVTIKESFGFAQLLELFIVTVILQQYGICVCGVILLFGQTTVQQDTFAMIFVMVAQWFVTINIALMAFMFVHLCLSTMIIQLKKIRHILRSMKTVLVATTVIMCLVVSVSEIGARVSTQWDHGMRTNSLPTLQMCLCLMCFILVFGRMYAFTIGGVCLVFLITMVIFAQKLLNALRRHSVQIKKSLTKDAAANIERAASRVRYHIGLTCAIQNG